MEILSVSFKSSVTDVNIASLETSAPALYVIYMLSLIL